MSQKIEHRETMTSGAVAELLRDFAAAFESGTLRLSHGDHQLATKTGRSIEMSLRAKGGDDEDEHKLELGLRWRTRWLEIDASVRERLDGNGQPTPRSNGELEAALRTATEECAEMSVADLYEAAREFGIEGRSQMNKSELVDAVAHARAASATHDRDELYERAKRLEIDGRSEMTKPELVEALRRADER